MISGQSSTQMRAVLIGEPFHPARLLSTAAEIAVTQASWFARAFFAMRS